MIIGFGHKAQTGKDTAGKYLVKYYGFTRLSFGDQLKRSVSNTTGISLHKFYDNKEEYDIDWGMTYREMLQKYGEAARVGFHEDTWVKRVMEKVIPGKNYVITDLRHVNEAKAVQKKGITVKISRDTSNYEIDRTHHSETGLDNFVHWDYYLDNNSDFSWLYGQIDGIMRVKKIRKRKPWEVFIYYSIPQTLKKIFNGITQR